MPERDLGLNVTCLLSAMLHDSRVQKLEYVKVLLLQLKPSFAYRNMLCRRHRISLS